MGDVEARLSQLSTQTTINTVISGVIMCLSILKPVLMEYIRRRWTTDHEEEIERTRQNSPTTTEED
jgi:hypothetical protein